MEVSLNSSELLQRIEKALDTIRPYLAADGGDIRVIEVTDEGILKIELLGSCENCPMSAMTMKAGIEESIRRSVPEILGVQAVNV
ncbi:MAG: NifU family protein [Microscillaceae bacterium]|nr:NifU family protein [Microscillaceae bacterium]